MSKSYRVVINADHCKACGLCIEFCPKKVLGFGTGRNSAGFHPSEPQDEQSCIGCRQCAMMCPDACIEIYRVQSAGEHATAGKA
jgi:2-oxoglutarate ferredoxin oxidoreductase subunit delta